MWRVKTSGLITIHNSGHEPIGTTKVVTTKQKSILDEPNLKERRVAHTREQYKKVGLSIMLGLNPLKAKRSIIINTHMPLLCNLINYPTL